VREREKEVGAPTNPTNARPLSSGTHDRMRAWSTECALASALPDLQVCRRRVARTTYQAGSAARAVTALAAAALFLRLAVGWRFPTGYCGSCKGAVTQAGVAPGVEQLHLYTQKLPRLPVN
jgi:hypothetical protein